ncbi:MAG TPA: hypothetical protein VNA20_04255 [Frankiaceae bacterium]|nr:hypothetical protein [Frankiaceae bacterium]
MAKDLGRSRAALPTAAWVRRGATDALAVIRPIDLTSGELSLYTTRGPAWRATVTVGSSDAMLIPVSGGVAVAGLSSAQYTGAPIVASVTVVSASSGTVRWSQQFAGQIDVQSSGDGNLLVTDLGTGTATKVAATTGKTLWQRGPEGTYRLWPMPLPDIDGNGTADIALVRLDSFVVIAGEDGRDLLVLGMDERPYPVGDVTGDGRSDLVVATGAASAAPSVRLIAGRTLKTMWTRQVAVGEHGSALNVTGRGGLNGTLLVHAVSGPTVALRPRDGRTIWLVPGPK